MGLLSKLQLPISDRYAAYLPLPTSSPRGSVSKQAGLTPNKAICSGALQGYLRAALHHLPPLKLILLLLGCFLFGHLSSSWFGDNNGGETTRVFLISDDKYHRIFNDENPGLASRKAMPIRAYDKFSNECVEEWVIKHTWGPHCQGTDLSEGLKIDGVWAWVNGSDPAQMASRQANRPETRFKMDAAHRYADHNELLYSMRSALSSLGPKVLTKMHIMASAYPMGDSIVGAGTKMIGQIPAWLRKDVSLSTNQSVVLHHDSEYFKPMPSIDDAYPINVEEWREKTIPSFNSLAVESQMFNLEDTDSDQLVYFNDDFFTLMPNSVSDFTSPLYGPVLKTLARVTSYYIPSEKPFQRLWNPAGEEVGIKHAAWVLGQRFPMRTLPYITHHPRTLWLPLLREAAQTFPEAFSDTTLARFRAQKQVPTSVQGFFLASWYIVERHREALLWSWIVAKWGGSEGLVTAERKQAMWAELHGGETQDSSIDVPKPVRTSADDHSAFQAAGVDVPQNTEYSFSSKDGHALSYLGWLWFWDRPRHGLPDLNSTQPAFTICKMSRSECLPSNLETASDLFKHIAFDKSDCGDCMVAALIGQSGERGIEAFMPPAHAAVSTGTRQGSPAHLPLTPSWRETEFSLSSVGVSGSLRTWCARLVQRYQYVLGSTRSEFFKVETVGGLTKKLHSMDNENNETNFLCLNDDITEGEEGIKKINGLLRSWFQSRWPTPMPVEVGA